MPENQPGRPDARQSDRLPPLGATCVEVFHKPDGLGPNLAAAVLNVSATGACLRLSQCLPRGHVLGVALYGPQRLLPVACAAVVVWSRDAGDGTFITGVQFARAAGEDNLAAVARPSEMPT